MTQHITDESDQCPSPEDLSAWVDLQLTDRKIEKHVETCANCKSILKSYRSIDEEIQGNLQRATQRDMGILVRIKDESMKQIRQQSPSPFGPGFTVRLVASIGVIGLLLYMVFHFSNYGSAGQDRAPHPTGEGNRIVDAPAITSIGEADKELLILAADHQSLFTDVEILGMGVDAELLIPTGREKEFRSVETSKTIHHQWQVADPASPMKFLKFLMPEKYREDYDRLIFQVADRGLVRLILTKNQLQQLVDDLSELNHKLLTPGEPQPNSGITGTAKITYQLEFQRAE